MPDPSISDALGEAYALAPADDVIVPTLELRHPLFVDANGNADSAWLVANTEDIIARVEADAPVRGGQMVRFVAVPFQMSLTPIEIGATPEIEIKVDNAGRVLVESLDRAVTSVDQIKAVYRPYLLSDLTSGPQMSPPPVFTLSSVVVDLLAVTAKARTVIDLRGAFPRMLYTASNFPGLIGY